MKRERKKEDWCDFREQYAQQQQRTSRLVPQAKREKEREKERTMIRPPSFLEMDLRTAKKFKEVSSKLKQSVNGKKETKKGRK